MENRDSIVRKLNALKAKFEHSATSEAEALAAMEKYNELMQKYNLTETDLHIRESGINFGKFRSDYSRNNVKQMPAMGWLITPIAMVTETKGILGHDKDAIFIGTGADVQYAEFLFRLIDNALVSSWSAYKTISREYKQLKAQGVHGKTIKNSFEKGFLQRMTAKLEDMMVSNKTTGNALVVLKNQLIAQAMEDASMKTSQNTRIARYQPNDAFNTGGAEADKVRLRQEADNQTKLLEGN